MFSSQSGICGAVDCGVSLGAFLPARSGDFFASSIQRASELGSRFLKIYESESGDRGGELRAGGLERGRQCRWRGGICGQAGGEKFTDGFAAAGGENEARCYGEVIEIPLRDSGAVSGCHRGRL